MNLTAFKFITDENIPHGVFDFLTKRGLDVIEVESILPTGSGDDTIIDAALRTGRIVITQDVGFGKSQFTGEIKKVGIIYIYPGHVGSATIIEILNYLFAQVLEIELPFIVIAQKKGEHLKIRTRNLFYQ